MGTMQPSAAFPAVTELASGYRVTYGRWCIEVGSNGVLYTPRRVSPDEIDEFVSALLAAARVGKQLRTPESGKPKPTLPLQIQWPDWWPR